ncbi:MAG: indole-3-glycerol-phosphate synthase [Candidatus Altiarchaeota archaeon]|nr:indole-3-glycerol-phosphate synthase [Candidatus Altiarchaeota archaeon]
MKFRFDKIAEEKEKEYRNLAGKRSLTAAIENAAKGNSIPVIAEVKRKSPSKGNIRDMEPAEAAKSMEKGGACAISVLTDGHFDGKICYLRQVKNAIKVPVLRKDFIVDFFQLYESRGNGADAVLLIASLLKEETKNFVNKTHELGMQALVEVRNETDLKYALDSRAKLIGINNRNLDTLKIDLRTTEKLAPNIPEDRIIVSESGIADKRDIERLLGCNVDCFLIGTQIMLAEDITGRVKELTKK